MDVFLFEVSKITSNRNCGKKWLAYGENNITFNGILAPSKTPKPKKIQKISIQKQKIQICARYKRFYALKFYGWVVGAALTLDPV